MTDDDRTSPEGASADEQVEDIEVAKSEADDVQGGKTPAPPGGPVPVPYPN